MPQLVITNTPAEEVGKHVNKIIQEHAGDLVCLLSGGSALDLVDYIHPGKECAHQECHDKKGATEKVLCERSECRTIFMMGDERVSRESTINNFLQLEQRYAKHPVLSRTIETVPTENETGKEFAHRIEKTFLETLTELINPKVIAILGIGTDGHTSGIFPMDEKSFRKTYQDDLTYVSVEPQGLISDSRASITPTWLLDHTDVIIGYVSGASKKQMLIEMNTNDKNLNERPAELLKVHKRAFVYTDQDITPDIE
jgi:6-phosphogluconolactonase/glucosamine-6-phosphate isomerase/deaminase